MEVLLVMRSCGSGRQNRGGEDRRRRRRGDVRLRCLSRVLILVVSSLAPLYGSTPRIRNTRVPTTTHTRHPLPPTSLLALVESYFSSIPVVPTRRAAQNRFARYPSFCTSVDVPLFPIIGYVPPLHSFKKLPPFLTSFV